ncbi:hypothetical protein ACPC37_08900 [Streptomyces griseoincarnatus]
MNVTASWSRVRELLRRHAPADHAALPGPAAEEMLTTAEECMGLRLPEDLRAWLLRNNLDIPEDEADDEVQRCGFGGFPDKGSFFLGVRAMERLYANRPLARGLRPAGPAGRAVLAQRVDPFPLGPGRLDGPVSMRGTAEVEGPASFGHVLVAL